LRDGALFEALTALCDEEVGRVETAPINRYLVVN
jgi:hypothetical protein